MLEATFNAVEAELNKLITKETKVKELIAEYEKICENIIISSGATIDENGDPVFNYDCDYDDQLASVEYETEYYTYLNVIGNLKAIIEE